MGGALLLSIPPLAGAATGTQQEGDHNSSQVWGSGGIRMQTTPEGATIEFDCGHGSILQPIKPDAGGEFTVTGTYTLERGGPIRKGNPPRDLHATYKGSISGDTMHLEIILTDNDQQPSPFTLTRGNVGKLVKCR